MARQERPEVISTKLVAIFLAGAALAVTLGVYGRLHDPTFRPLFTLFFSDTINLKAWFATFAFLLAFFQLFSALRMYGVIGVPKEMPRWMGRAHRLTGRTAIILTLPVAFHCLWSLGFNPIDTRTLVHSVMGCFFYGAFMSKVMIVRSDGLPRWALPVAGGSLFTALTLLWLTSSLWFFQNFGFPAF